MRSGSIFPERYAPYALRSIPMLLLYLSSPPASLLLLSTSSFSSLSRDTSKISFSSFSVNFCCCSNCCCRLNNRCDVDKLELGFCLKMFSEFTPDDGSFESTLTTAPGGIVVVVVAPKVCFNNLLSSASRTRLPPRFFLVFNNSAHVSPSSCWCCFACARC